MKMRIEFDDGFVIEWNRLLSPWEYELFYKNKYSMFKSYDPLKELRGLNIGPQKMTYIRDDY